MLATLFEKTTTSSYLNAGIVLFFVSIFRYATQYGQEFDSSIVSQQALESILVYLTMLTSSLYFRASSFLRDNNYYALFFFLIYAFVPNQAFSPTTWFSLSLIFWIAILFLRTPWKKAPQKTLMDISLFMTLILFLNPIFIFFFPLYVVALYLSDIKKTQFFLIPITISVFLSFTMFTLNELYPILPIQHFSKVTQFSNKIDLKNLTLETFIWIAGIGVSALWLVRQLVWGSQFNNPQKNSFIFQAAFYSLNLAVLLFFQAAQYNLVLFLPLLAFVFKAVFLHKANRFSINLYVLLFISGFALKWFLLTSGYGDIDMLGDIIRIWPF